MGNFWIPHFDSSSSSPCSTRPSSPAISRNNSNEGTHSGSRSAFASGLNEVSPYCQILPIAPNSRIFSFAELKMATWNFSLNALIGGGDFGLLFKGWIDEKTFAATTAESGMAIAIKKLNFESSQEWEQWKSDVNLLGCFSRPNESRLLGYCWEDKELLLVFKFTPGNLVKWAKPYLSDWSEVLSRVMDRRLEGHYPSEGVVQAARLILQCLCPVPRNRPSMTEVVEALELSMIHKAYAPSTEDRLRLCVPPTTITLITMHESVPHVIQRLVMLELEKMEGCLW